jgi:hypothetical protein
MALSIAVVSGTLHGWWKLGRSMTLSPVDIACSFNAPVLRSRIFSDGKALDREVTDGGTNAGKSNADMDSLLKDIGDLRIKYGEGTFSSNGNGDQSPPESLEGTQRAATRLGFGVLERIRSPQLCEQGLVI